jgi:thymidylate synthase (FAD)
VEEFDQEFDGISRELARICLPLSTYTEIVWKQNLHNIFHLLKLRLDPHAQYETRVFAEAMYELIKPKFPLAVEAFEDYSRQAKTLSRMEVVLMRDLLNDRGGELTVRVLNADNYDDFPGVEADLIEKYGLSRRELREFIKNFITTD